jgi:hypothetical protein
MKPTLLLSLLTLAAPWSTLAAQTELAPIEDPKNRVTQLDEVEDYSEDVANTFVEWSDKIRRRDFAAAADLLTEGFRGHDLARMGRGAAKQYPLAVTKTSWEIAPPVVDGAGFLDGLREFVSPLGTIEFFFVKVRGAEFGVRAGGALEGTITTRINATGRGSGGGRIGREVHGRAHVVRQDGRWQIDRWAITAASDLQRPESIFTECALGAGVAHRGPQFGKEGNSSFFWNGAAVSDYDADGRFDIFVPSQERNFLYRNKGDGTFEECAEAAGVAQPPGGTGAVFFDADNDGDRDLLVAHPGWEEGDGVVGRPTQLYRNDGKGRFANVSVEAGFKELLCAFSPVVADCNGDGWLDVFVCGYQRGGFTGPNSWVDATNGSRNALYLNQGGKFVDVAERVGFPENRWTYAAAWHDYDEDGDQDLFVANDYGSKELWRNDGDLHFTEVSRELGVADVGNGMGCAFADYDSDGDVDLYAANMSSTAGNRILGRLLGSGQDETGLMLKKFAAGNTLFAFDGKAFMPVDPKFGGVGAAWAWASQFLDIDLDGDLDLACVNGFISGDSLKDT